MKPIKIEEQFINLLTKCAWWIDIRFGKGAIWFSLCYIVSSSVLLCIFQAVDSFSQTEDFTAWVIYFLFKTIGFIVAFLLFWWMNIFLSYLIYGEESVLKNTTVMPNPNKYSKWMFECRYAVIFPPMFNSLLYHSFLDMLGIIFVSVPSLYILCVDPVPPGLKKKKLEEKEFGNLKPVTNT